MSRLVLTRKAGQAVRLETSPGNYSVISVAYIGRDFVKLDYGIGSQWIQAPLELKDKWTLLPDLVIHLVSIQFSTAKLVFEAPSSIKIVRTELLTDREAV